MSKRRQVTQRLTILSDEGSDAKPEKESGMVLPTMPLCDGTFIDVDNILYVGGFGS